MSYVMNLMREESDLWHGLWQKNSLEQKLYVRLYSKYALLTISRIH